MSGRRDQKSYEARAKAQMFAWASGRPYHEKVSNECCPDFSCCQPGMFTADSSVRWAQYQEKYGHKRGNGE